MARSFNPPPNWPKPPEGWQPPPGWQPDPAWGPAPEGWELWVENPDNDAAAAYQSSSPSDDDSPTAADDTISATSASATSAGVGQTGEMPQYQGPPTGQQPVNSTQPQGTWSGGNGGASKLPWILGAVIALLMVILLVLLLVLTGVFGNDNEQASGASSPSSSSSDQSSPSGDSSSGGPPEVSDDATRLAVDPEGAKEVKNPSEPEATFTQDDGEIELPRPNGDDAPQLISVTVKSDRYVSFEAEHKDGSTAYVRGAGGIFGEDEEYFQLLSSYSYERGNPVTKVWTEDDGDFEIKVYNLDDLQNIDGGNIKGDGSAVFTLDIKDSSTWYKLSHNGASVFGVQALADYEDGTYDTPEMMANESGRSLAYGEFEEGKWLVMVEADGKWGFEESTKELAREAAVAEIWEDEE